MANSKEIVIKIEGDTDSSAVGGQIIECDSSGKWIDSTGKFGLIGPLAKSLKRTSTWAAVIDANGKFTIPDISISTYYHIKQVGTLPSIVKSDDLIKTGEVILKKDPNSSLENIDIITSIPVKPVQPVKPASTEDGTRFEYEINNDVNKSRVSVSLYAIIQRNGKIIDDRIIASSSTKKYKKDSTGPNSIDVIATELKRQVIFDSENLISYRYDTLISEDEVTLRTFENRLPSQISKAEANYIIPKTKKEITGNEVVTNQNNYEKNGLYNKTGTKGTSAVIDVNDYYKAKNVFGNADKLTQKNDDGKGLVFTTNNDRPNNDNKPTYNKPTTYNNSLTNINNQSVLNSEANNINETQSTNSSNQITNSASSTKSNSNDSYLNRIEELKGAKAEYKKVLNPIKYEIGGKTYTGSESKLTKDEKANAYKAIQLLDKEINRIKKLGTTAKNKLPNTNTVLKQEATGAETSKETKVEPTAGMAAAVEKATDLSNKKLDIKQQSGSNKSADDTRLQQLTGMNKTGSVEPAVNTNPSSLVENINKIINTPLQFESRKDITNNEEVASDIDITAKSEQLESKKKTKMPTVQKNTLNPAPALIPTQTKNQKKDSDFLASIDKSIKNVAGNTASNINQTEINNNNNLAKNNQPVAELVNNTQPSNLKTNLKSKKIQEKPKPVGNSQSELNSQLLNAIYDLLSTGIKVKYS